MIIVIEGADGTGKTTLAKRFVERGFQYVHNGVPPPDVDMFEEYTRQILEAQDSGRDVVFDRLHLGELVYGTHVRGNPRLTLEHLALLNRLLFSRGGVLVICHTLDKVAESNWKRRKGQEYVTSVDTLRAINRSYGLLYEDMRGSNVFCYDYAHDVSTSDDMLTYLTVMDHHCPRGVIGSPEARFLFVGEQPGGERDLAFYSAKKSSNFLNNALWDAGYLEREMAFTNARDKAGATQNLHRIYRDYNRKVTVVALGCVAQRACLEQGVPFLPLDHPQYVKRFKLRKRDAYVSQLRRWRE